MGETAVALRRERGLASAANAVIHHGTKRAPLHETRHSFTTFRPVEG
jgi:hypothetical protein